MNRRRGMNVGWFPTRRTRGGFTPAVLSPFMWLEAGQGFYQDSAGTTPATANADPLGLWQDQSGNGRHVSQATSGSRPVLLANAHNGRMAPTFNARSLASGSVFDSSFNTAMTVIVTSRYVGNGAQVHAGIAGITYLSGRQDEKLFWYIRSGFRYNPISTGETVGIQTLRYDGSTARTRWNGREVSEAVTGNLGLSGAITLGDVQGGQPTWQGQILDYLIFNSVLSDVNVGLVEGYLATINALNGPRVTCEGDSLTSGLGSTAGNDYPARLAVVLGATWTKLAYGSPGDKLTTITSHAAAEISPLYTPLRSKNVLIVWCGTNDLILDDVSLATLKTRMTDYCAARRNEGFYVIYLEIMDRVDFSSDQRTRRSDFNAWLPSRIGTDFDALMTLPVGLSGVSPWSGSPSLWSADNVHLTDAGYQLVADTVAPLVTAA